MIRILYIGLWFSFALSLRAANDSDWTLFDDPSARQDYGWAAEIKQFIHPIRQQRFDIDKRFTWVKLRGTFSLPDLDDAGRVLRFNFRDRMRKCRILFQAGPKRYRIECDSYHHNYLAASLLIGPENDRNDLRKSQRITDDIGRWYAYQGGLLDVRYQAGQVLLTRASQVLLRFPVEAPPTNLVLEAEHDTDLELFQVLKLPPVKWEKEPYAVPKASFKPAATLNWKLDNHYHGREEEDPVRMVKHKDGRLEMSTKSAKDWRRVETKLDRTAPMILGFKIDAMAHGAGLTFNEEGMGYMALKIARKDGLNLICSDPNSNSSLERSKKRGFVVEFPFYARLVYGLDHTMVDISQDGELWFNYHRQHLTQQMSKGPLKIELLFDGRKKGKPQNIILSKVSLQLKKLLDDLVNQDVVRQIPAFDDTIRRTFMRNVREKRSPQWIEGKPDNVSELDWRMASDWALMHRNIPALFKQVAARDLLEAFMEKGLESHIILKAIQSVSPWLQPQKWGGDNRSISYSAILQKLSEYMLRRGDAAAFPLWMDTWYALNFDLQIQRDRDHRVLPPSIFRYTFYERYHQRQWKALRYEALRYIFYARPYKDNQLAYWMLYQAAAKLGEPVMTNQGFALHPLRMTTDRETQNLIGEFTAAAKAGEDERACRILVNGQINLGLAQVEKDADLFKSAALVLQEMIESNPRVKAALVEHFSDVGQIRLSRSLEQGRFDLLEQMVTQFHGTPASRQASIILADRDLSSGLFSRAVSRYEQGLKTASGEEHVRITAKLNLALSLMGNLPVLPMTTQVSLPGGTFTSQEYNQVLQTIYHQRSFAEADRSSKESFPEPGAMKIQSIGDVSIGPHFPYAASQHGSFLILQQNERICAVDLEKRLVLWKTGAIHKNQNTTTLMPAVNDRYVVCVLPKKPMRTLMCFDRQSGKVIWEKSFHTPITSSPVIMKGTLYLLTQEAGGQMAINRLSLDQGRLVFSRGILPDHQDEKRSSLKRLFVSRDRILIADKGMVICCNESGDLEWVRRLPSISYTADRGLYGLHPRARNAGSWRQAMSVSSAEPIGFFTKRNEFVLCNFGSPMVSKFELSTGREAWSILQPQRRFWMGAQDHRLYLRNVESIKALDGKKGTPLWDWPVDEEATYGFAPGSEHIVELRLDRVNSHKKHTPKGRDQRWIRWISSRTGTLEKEELLPDQGLEVFDVARIFPYQGKVFLLGGHPNNKHGREPLARLAVLEPK